MRWEWSDFWAWFEQIEGDEMKTAALWEINAGGWLSRLSPETQVDVMCHAPSEIINSLDAYPTIFTPKTIAMIRAEHHSIIRKKRRKIK